MIDGPVESINVKRVVTGRDGDPKILGTTRDSGSGPTIWSQDTSTGII